MTEPAQGKDAAMTDDRHPGFAPLTVDLERAQCVCQEIADDMAADAAAFDGKPFNGRTVAEYFGNQGAAIAALAGIVKQLVALAAAPQEDDRAERERRIALMHEQGEAAIERIKRAERGVAAAPQEAPPLSHARMCLSEHVVAQEAPRTVEEVK